MGMVRTRLVILFWGAAELKMHPVHKCSWVGVYKEHCKKLITSVMTNYKHRVRHGGKLWQFAIHTSNPKTGLVKV